MASERLTEAEWDAVVSAAIADVSDSPWTHLPRLNREVERIIKARVRAARAEAWDEGYSAGQKTWAVAETQAPNPYDAVQDTDGPRNEVVLSSWRDYPLLWPEGEPCAREHQPGYVCIAPNGHDPDSV